MQIFRCELELMENCFFSSREINNYFQTAPVIGNYALTYALGLCAAGYFADQPTYLTDLKQVNEKGIYVTPAQIQDRPRFSFGQFNALAETYYQAMAQNAIAISKEERTRAINRPQIGKIKMLALGNRFRFFVLSEDHSLQFPTHFRLGKFMSKAKLTVFEEEFQITDRRVEISQTVLNPNDLAAKSVLKSFDLLNIPPVPLVQNPQIESTFYQLKSIPLFLPAGMKYGVAV